MENDFPSWIEDLVVREATPPDLREENYEEFCSRCDISKSTYYNWVNKPKIQEKILNLSMRLAKKHTSEVLENLGKRAKKDNRAAELYLKFVLELAEKRELSNPDGNLSKIILIKDNGINDTTSSETDGSI